MKQANRTSKPATSASKARTAVPVGTRKPSRRAGADAAVPEFPELSSSERAYKILTRAIERGELKGGTRLREGELATQIGMSRTPVREALARLVEQGLIVNDGSRGLVVVELDHRAITELYAMREVLEGMAARLAAQHATEIEVAILRKIVERNSQLLDPHDLAENNRLFHGTMYRCSHNRYLLKMLRTTHESMLLLGQSALSSPAASDIWTRQHMELVEAIERHDVEAAERLAKAAIAAAFTARLSSVLADIAGGLSR